MKKLLSYCLNKWWLLPLISTVIIGLSFLFDSIWFIIIGLLLVVFSVVYQFIKKRWKTGCLTGMIMLLLIILSGYWYLLQTFPSQDKILSKYSERYENRSEIERIIGIEIPKFEIVDSKVKHLSSRGDSEFEIETIIEFKELPSSKLFENLDSIILLPNPKELTDHSSFFYYGLESIISCWSKEGDKYKYNRNTDFGGAFLHSTDAYYIFELTKGVKTAKIIYGNY
jgi:energy-coupling factor transporter transmembrane protein EcfT